MENKDIISKQATDLDLALGLFCTNCLHDLKEHSIGKCYALENNGSVWIACNCKSFKNELKMKAKVKDGISNKEIAKSESKSIAAKGIERESLFKKQL